VRTRSFTIARGRFPRRRYYERQVGEFKGL